jgi:hypothetical protein
MVCNLQIFWHIRLHDILLNLKGQIRHSKFLKTKYIQKEGSDMVLKYFHKKQRAKLSFSSLPIGDTPVLIFSASPGTYLDVSGLESPSSDYGKMSNTKVRDKST